MIGGQGRAAQPYRPTTLQPELTVLGRPRFNPVDPRCGMTLDSIDPLEWAKLEAATDDYVHRSGDLLDSCAALLCSGPPPGAAPQDPEPTMTRIGERSTHARIPHFLHSTFIPCTGTMAGLLPRAGHKHVFEALMRNIHGPRHDWRSSKQRSAEALISGLPNT